MEQIRAAVALMDKSTPKAVSTAEPATTEIVRVAHIQAHSAVNALNALVRSVPELWINGRTLPGIVAVQNSKSILLSGSAGAVQKLRHLLQELDEAEKPEDE